MLSISYRPMSFGPNGCITSIAVLLVRYFAIVLTANGARGRRLNKIELQASSQLFLIVSDKIEEKPPSESPLDQHYRLCTYGVYSIPFHYLADTHALDYKSGKHIYLSAILRTSQYHKLQWLEWAFTFYAFALCVSPCALVRYGWFLVASFGPLICHDVQL